MAVFHGTEIVYHAICLALEAHPTWADLNVDVANAFIALDHVPMFDTLCTSPHF